MGTSYKGVSSKADVKEFFSGKTRAWGMLQNWRGQVTRRFTVEISGAWKGNTGTLDEKFIFDDGEKQRRVWTLTMRNEHSFTATAADVVGIAQGEQAGHAIHMEYVLAIPVKGRTINIAIDDWLYLLDDTGKRLMNVSTLKKFGLPVGKLTIYFEKEMN